MGTIDQAFKSNVVGRDLGHLVTVEVSSELSQNPDIEHVSQSGEVMGGGRKSGMKRPADKVSDSIENLLSKTDYSIEQLAKKEGVTAAVKASEQNQSASTFRRTPLRVRVEDLMLATQNIKEMASKRD